MESPSDEPMESPSSEPMDFPSSEPIDISGEFDMSEAFDALLKTLLNPTTEFDDDFEEAALILNNGAAELRRRYDETGDREFLDQAIILGTKAKEHPSSTMAPGRPIFIGNLAKALSIRSELDGNIEDSDKALALAGESYQLASTEPEYFARVALTMTQIFEMIHQSTGNLSHINEIISICSSVMQQLDEGGDQTSHAWALMCMASALSCRQKSTWGAADINLAVTHGVTAVKLAATIGDKSLHAYACNILAYCLFFRFNRHSLVDDITGAIKYGKQCLSNTGDSGPSLHAVRLNNLANYHWAKAKRVVEDSGNDLEEAIGNAELAYEITSSDEALFGIGAEVANTLGICLQERFDRHPSFSDIKRSISLGYEALALKPPHHIDQVDLLSNLAFRLQRASAYCLQHGLPQEIDVLPPGCNCEQEWIRTIYASMEISHASPSIRIAAAFAAARFLEDTPVLHGRGLLGQLYGLLRDALELLPSTTAKSLIDDCQFTLSRFFGLASLAAAAALEAKLDAYEALRVLELGRGVLISMSLDKRSEPAVLEQQFNDLVVRSEELQMQLYSLHRERGGFEKARELDLEFSKVLEEIWQNPEFKHSTQPLSRSETIALADKGPIIVINVTKLRSDALVVINDEIRAINIPGLNSEAVSKSTVALQELLEDIANREKNRADLNSHLHTHFRRLWKILSRLLDEIGIKGTPVAGQWPHVWWVPTGVLSLLPLHAAGVPLPRGQSVMDRVISSYTPTLKALAHTRYKLGRSRTAMPSPKPEHALVISMKQTPGCADLPSVDTEVCVVKRAMGETHVTVLEGPTKPMVLDALGSSSKSPSLVHFTCHGEKDYREPFQSTLLLSDWQTTPLTVRDLQRERIRAPSLAYLSACYAAHGGDEILQDESIHLASACQIAGFSGVVGSLWPVEDRDSCAVVKEFYEILFTKEGFDVESAAEALHMAVLKLRESSRSVFNCQRGEPLRWAPFVYFGV